MVVAFVYLLGNLADVDRAGGQRRQRQQDDKLLHNGNQIHSGMVEILRTVAESFAQNPVKPILDFRLRIARPRLRTENLGL